MYTGGLIESMAAGVTEESRASIHPTATVEDGAVIGAGTRVWHYVHVRSEAVIGASCVLGKDVFVDGGARVGDGVKVQNGVSLYRGVTLEDDVFVGPAAAFTNDLRPRAHSRDWQVTPTVVRRGASIGANATVVCGVELGEDCMVGAGAVVTRTVAPHELVAGNPARRRGWVCRCGEVISRSEQPPASMACASCRTGGAGR